MATRLSLPRYQVAGDTGTPLPGAKLYFYAAGTSTPKNTYSDEALSTPNANPLVADSAGRFGDIFLTTGQYKIVLQTSAGVTVWTADPVDGAADAAGAGGTVYAGSTAGTSTALTATVTPAITAYTTGVRYTIKLHTNSGAAPSLNLNSLGAVALKKVTPAGIVALTANDLRSGEIAAFWYDGTVPALYLDTPSANHLDISQDATLLGSYSVAGGATINSAGTMPLTIAPIANTLSTGTALTVAATTQTESKREFALSVGLTSNKGGTRANTALAWQDKVGIYSGVDAVAGTGDVWALNTVTTMNAGSGSSYHAQGYELDFNNNLAHRGDGDAGSGLAGYAAYGLSVTGAGAFRSNSAILVSGPGSGIWNRGITFSSSCISSTGSTFQDLCAGHSKSLDIRGSPTWGVYQEAAATSNFFGGTYTFFGNSANTSPISATANGMAYRHGAGIDIYTVAATPISCGRGNNGVVQLFTFGTTSVGSIAVTSTTTTYNTSSDYRRKQDVVDMTGAEAEALLRAMRPRMGRFKVAPDEALRPMFLAHEYAAPMPHAVTGEKDAVDETGEAAMQTAAYDPAVPALVAALRYALDRIAALEAGGG